MNHHEKVELEPTIEPYEARLYQFLTQLSMQAESPQAGDTIMGDFYMAASERYSSDNRFAAIVNGFVDMREDLEAAPALNLFFRAWQFTAEDLDNRHYPRYRGKPYDVVKWDNVIAEILESGPSMEIINEELKHNVLSNVPDRVIELVLIIEAMKRASRINEPARVLDVGCGSMLGLKKATFVNRHPMLFRFSQREVYEAGLDFDADNTNIINDSEGFTAVNSILSSPPFFEGVGIDVEDINDKQVRKRRRSHSFRPLERIIKPNPFDEYNLFDTMPMGNFPNLEFRQTDIFSADAVRYLSGLEKFDVINMSFFMYPFKSAQRAYIYDLLEACTHDKSVIAMLDFTYVPKDNPSHPRTFRNWSPDWRCRTVIQDMMHPGLWQEAHIWDTGRLNRLIQTAAHLSISGGRAVPIQGLISE